MTDRVEFVCSTSGLNIDRMQLCELTIVEMMLVYKKSTNKDVFNHYRRGTVFQ